MPTIKIFPGFGNVQKREVHTTDPVFHFMNHLCFITYLHKEWLLGQW